METNFWNIIWTLFALIAVLYVVYSLYLAIFQSRFVYFPEPLIEATPEAIGLEYEDVSLEAADGVKLSAWFIPSNEQRAVAIFCHGNAGNISHRLHTIKLLNRLGLSTLIFDYRGYGQSEGNPSEKGTYLDVEAAWQYIVDFRGIEPEKIIILGRSLGGAIAAYIAQKHKPGMLVIESTFTSIPDMAAVIYPYIPVRLLSRIIYPTAKYISEVKCPVLIVHSRHDDIIPFDHGLRLFEMANQPKKFLEISGNHNEGYMISVEQHEEHLRGFISKYL